MNLIVRFARVVPFLLAGILVGWLITLQFNSPVQPTTSFAFDQYEFQEDLVQTFADDQEELEDRLNELTEQVEEAEIQVSNLYSNIDADYLQKLKDTLGLSQITGDGIEIVIDDNPSVTRDSTIVDTNNLVHAADLRDLVNLLRTFTGDPIAINDQRIVASTPITNAGNTILINNFTVVPPFRIQIITNVPDLVIQKISDESELPSIYSRMISHDLQFKFRKMDEITLPAYIGGYSTEYIQAPTNEN